jgi:hypothetical protein
VYFHVCIAHHVISCDGVYPPISLTSVYPMHFHSISRTPLGSVPYSEIIMGVIEKGYRYTVKFERILLENIMRNFRVSILLLSLNKRVLLISDVYGHDNILFPLPQEAS